MMLTISIGNILQKELFIISSKTNLKSELFNYFFCKKNKVYFYLIKSAILGKV